MAWKHEHMTGLNVKGNLYLYLRNLYEGAKATVIVNQVGLDRLELHGGTRQGDPLSLLIFALAIEPLAIKIREMITLLV